MKVWRWLLIIALCALAGGLVGLFRGSLVESGIVGALTMLGGLLFGDRRKKAVARDAQSELDAAVNRGLKHRAEKDADAEREVNRAAGTLSDRIRDRNRQTRNDG